MKNKINEKVYIGKTHRIIIEQPIGGLSRVLEELRKTFDVKELKNHTHTVILIEEKEDEQNK